MAWVYLFAAGICEIVWATGLKLYGFTLTRGGAFTVFMMLLSFILLDQAMKRLPLGTSYAIWTGIGAVGAAIIGIVRFNEPRDWPRVMCIALIVIGIVGLKLLHREPVLPVAGATSAQAATADGVPSTPQDVVR